MVKHLVRHGKNLCRGYLYPVDIIEKQDSRIRIHYVGYEDHFDEWKDEAELEVLEQDVEVLESPIECAEVLKA